MPVSWLQITNTGAAIVRGKLAKWPLEGSLSYMAPELYWCLAECSANSLSLPCATDVWSFGATMLACATGFNPFDLGTVPLMCMCVLSVLLEVANPQKGTYMVW